MNSEEVLAVIETAVLLIEIIVLIALYHHLRSLKEHTEMLKEHMDHLESHVIHMRDSMDDMDRKLKGHYEAVTGMFDEIDIDKVMEMAHEKTGKGEKKV